MPRALALAVLLAALLAPAALAGSPRILHVHRDVAAPGDGSSWDSAFARLQDALAVASPGDRLWVAEGRYFGGFDVPAGVAILGGFPPGAFRETQRSPRRHPVVLDGGRVERVLVLNDGSLVDGLVIENGRADFPGGGGALVDGTSPILRKCLFRENRNTAGRGAALAVRERGNPLVQSCAFVNNRGSGHAVDVDRAGGTYDHIVVHGNTSNGFHIQRASDPKIHNSVFSRNSGRGVCVIHGTDTPIVENNLFHENQVAIYHSRGFDLRTIEEVNALSYARDNLDADPMFMDVSRLDFRLQPGSPCIEAGVAFEDDLLLDAHGNPRALDGDLDGVIATDIGFLEYCNLDLDVQGEVVPGGTITVTVTGTERLNLLFTAGFTPGSFEAIAPLGAWALSGAPGVRLIPAGTIPFAADLRIPARLTAGTGIVVQAAGYLGRQQGNLSNYLDLVVGE